MRGAGTRSSPIAIDADDDSEDEVFQELVDTSPHSTPHTGSPPRPPSNFEIPGPSTEKNGAQLNEDYPCTSAHPASRVLYGNGLVNGKNLKRPRSNSVVSVEDADPSRTGNPATSLENRLTAPVDALSKKARKRRRRAEREKQNYAARLARLQNNPSVAPQFPIGLTPMQFAVMDPFQFLHPYHPPPPHPNYPSSSSAFSLDYNESYGNGYFDMDEPPPSQPPLDWVQSMAMAADQAAQPTETSHDPPTSQWMQVDIPPSKVGNTGASPPPAVGPNPAKFEAHTLPPKPQTQTHGSQIIGMKPDQSPNSKHGIFEVAGRQNALEKAYIPNPARTLVMEQLPKSYRHLDFVNSWCRKACGAQAVKVLIDAAAAKALIEFATAELARKAWGSPKLGSSYIGLKPHQLKGKPREDLIKVWWYRVDGIGAGAGVGEIEEGEIEGDAPEKEMDDAHRKETKKERKARLAKQREDKSRRAREFVMGKDMAPSTDASQPGASSLPVAQPSSTSTVWNASLPPRPQPPTGPTAFQRQSLTNSREDRSSYGTFSAQADLPAAGTSIARSESPIQLDEDMDIEGDEMDTTVPVGYTARSQTTTPTLTGPTPSEPRAMKNAPTAPSHLKRILEARKKELEERIAQSKLELAARGQRVASPAAGTSPSPAATTAIPAGPAPFSATGAPDAGSKQQAMENRLREMVLQSQKNKNKTNIPAPSSDVPPASNHANNNEAESLGTTISSQSFSFDEMAVSFINQTIQTAKVRPSPPLPAPVPNVRQPLASTLRQPVSGTSLDTKTDLGRLEHRIAETKRLMGQLEQARTKSEKDAILATLRDIQRSTDKAQTMKTSLTAAVGTQPKSAHFSFGANGTKQTQRQEILISRWPNFHADPGPLIVSDDEDEDEDD